MIQGLQDLVNSVLNRMSRQDVIANNIANSNVAGFKRDGLFTRELGEARRKGSGVHPVWRNDRIAGVFIDFELGSLRRTNTSQHIAIKRVRESYPDPLYCLCSSQAFDMQPSALKTRREESYSVMMSAKVMPDGIIGRTCS